MFGVKDPAPPLQIPPVAIVTNPPIGTLALLRHKVKSGPAFAVGLAVKDSCTWSVTAMHVPLPVVVNVSVTFPFAISTAVGV